VVISIQAMILCEEPWYNEPGRSYGTRDLSEGPSAVYNAKTRRNTIRTAMLEWIENTPPIWKDVVDRHFTADADKILHTAVTWSKKKIPDWPYGHIEFSAAGLDDEDMAAMQRLSAQSHDGLDSILPQLQAALYKYGASKIVPDPQPHTQASSAASLKRARDATKALKPAHTPPPQLSQLPQLPQLPPMYMPLGPLGLQGPNPHMPHFNYPYMQNPHSQTAPQQGPWAQFDNFTLPTLGNFSASGGLFTGPGRTLGHGATDQQGPEAQNNGGRGGSFLSTLGLGRGRYETRSSTRGRGGPGSVTNAGGSSFNNSPGFGEHPRGGGYIGPPGRGGYHADQGRGGGRGHFHDQGRGDLGGQGDGLGRGGRGGRGGFGGLNDF
jgi:hypothetical protein